MNENPVRHDYTHETCKSGWAIVDFEFLDVGRVKVTAFGLKRGTETLEGAYLLPGEEIVVSMPDGEVLYEIVTINYQRDPYDMYEAELKYIQHLSGLRILRQTGDTERARQMEWGRRHSNA